MPIISKPKYGVGVWHCSYMPFMAICGSKRKNQRTTQETNHVTCKKCIKILTQNYPDSVKTVLNY